MPGIPPGDPESPAVKALATRFPKADPAALQDGLAQKLSQVETSFMNELTPKGRTRFELRIHCNLLPYTAYLFDADELWVIPNSMLPGRHVLPVLVFSGENMKKTVYYTDVSKIGASPQYHDPAK